MHKVLIVDDDENNRAVISDALEGEDFSLDEADDGSVALRKSLDDPPDLILLDVMMPGMDGIETLRQLNKRDTTRSIPVIMVTALNMDSQVAACLNEGAVDHIAKPFSNMVLRARITAALRSKSNVGEVVVPPRGKVIAFVGAKGGVGTTTVCINVGAKLTQVGKVVTICELRNDFGTASAQLGETPYHHLGRMFSENPERISRDKVKDYLCKDASGIHLLYSPRQADDLETLTPEYARNILDGLAQQSEFALIDLPPFVSEVNDAVLTAVDYVIVVMDMETTCVVAARRLLERIHTLGIGRHGVGAVAVNRTPSSAPTVHLNEIRESLECDLVGAITPAPEAFAMATKKESPLVIFQPDTTAASALASLANRITSDRVTALPS